jgi:hypothetical protein
MKWGGGFSLDLGRGPALTIHAYIAGYWVGLARATDHAGPCL